MKKFVLSSVLLSVFIFFAPTHAALEEYKSSEWKPVDVSKIDSEPKAEELKQQKEEELSKAQEEEKKATTEEEKTQAKLTVDRVQYDLNTIDAVKIDKQWGDYASLSDADAQNKIATVQNKQLQLDDRIKTEEQKLAQILTQNVPKESLSQFTQDSLELIKASNWVELGKLAGSLDEQFDVTKIAADVAKESDIAKKMAIIEQQRKILRPIKEAYEDAVKDESVKFASDIFSKNFKTNLDEKLSDLNNLSIDTNLLHGTNFFTRAAQVVVDWFKQNFDFFKSTWETRTVDAEYKKAQEIQNLPGFDSSRQYMFDFVALQNNMGSKIKNLPELSSISQADYDKEVKNSNKLLKTAAKNIIDMDGPYRDLEQLQLSVVGKMDRYKQEFFTLFDKLYTDYNSKELVGRPEKAYEALGFTDKKPEDITVEDIKKAWENQQKILVQDSPGWKAARDASNILSEPVQKLTYDAFLKDFEYLKITGINPAQKEKPADIINELNTGLGRSLNKLEITKDVYSQIVDKDNGVLPYIIDTLVPEVQSRRGVGEKLSEMISGLSTQLTTELENLKGRIVPSPQLPPESD